MKKIVTSILLLAFISYTNVSYAAVPTPGQLSQAIKVADINIVDTKIISQSNNTITVSFGISNGAGIQTGVKYGVRLQKEDKTTQYIVDEKIYDEELTLPENTVVKRQVVYTAPSQLSGDYKLYITSQNANGFPFGIAPAGPIQLNAATQGIFIDPATCTISGKSITQPAVIAPATPLSVQCTFSNTDKTALTVQPIFQTRYESAYGDIAPASNNTNNTVAIAPGEKKAITLQIPTSEKPQRYVALLHVNANNAVVSNTVTIPYVITGASATIQNATLDKASYKKGEQATVSVVYAAIDVGQNATMSVDLSSGTTSCAQTVTQPLSSTSPVLSIPIPVQQECAHPQVTVSIKNQAGTVLDQKTFGQAGAPVNNRTMGIIVIAIVIILLAAYLLKKKKPAVATMLLILGVGMLPLSHTDAASYAYSPSGYRGSMVINVNVDRSPATYNAGDPIVTSAYYTSYSPDNFPVYLTVSTPNGGSATLVPVASIAAYNSSGVQSAVISAPRSGGASTVDFQVYYESRLIMGSTSAFATSSQACTLGDPNSHGYYQPLPYNPNGPSTGSYLYLSSGDYTSGIPFNGGNGWIAMQYFFSSLTSASSGWSYASPTYAAQVDTNGKIIAAINC